MTTSFLDKPSDLLSSFGCIAYPDAKLLILGSMPGKASLEQNQYYAHPRNAFWPIMAELFGFSLTLDYQQRLQKLVDNQVALWDVMKHCQRQSSLDSDIVESSIVANDFVGLLKQHANINAIALNGKKAQQSFQRYVWQGLFSEFPHVKIIELPSTSPANARMKLQEKIDVWQTNLRPVL
ncbi:DNA-deoxyinosine glycosylase [Saccharobesus litoralis]|uniref:DNA-deoxyinosine glycosylase n=1 Tax=Saccharobesus litoralis TaxID=2172099 RepID=A0A2S0VV75_9ALTE|nr:DNA-deoxyinosine glycosylase [Saccharobesus litoralis]AWB68072.1 DNA-deoxyinosine glycosylase [Saccharobesus litoralis]